DAVVADVVLAVKQFPGPAGRDPGDGTCETVTRSTCWCTNTGTGVLVTPSAATVTLATPAPPGEQTRGSVKLSQVPAHATPVLETVSTAGLLELKVKVKFPIRFLERSFAVARKTRVEPMSMEPLVGVSVTVAGSCGPAGVLLLPHADKPISSVTL